MSKIDTLASAWCAVGAYLQQHQSAASRSNPKKLIVTIEVNNGQENIPEAE